MQRCKLHKGLSDYLHNSVSVLISNIHDPHLPYKYSRNEQRNPAAVGGRALSGAQRQGEPGEAASAYSCGGLEGPLSWGPLLGLGATAITEYGAQRGWVFPNTVS